MTEMTSSPIQQRTVARQTTEPANPLDGFLWINPAGGDLDNNTERYLYNGETDSWDLLDSTGPDTPLHAAAGASWTDTGNGTVKNYRNGVWENVGVTDHANLSNVTASQHHSRPVFKEESGTWSGTMSSMTTKTVTFSNTFKPGTVSVHVGVMTTDNSSSTSGGKVSAFSTNAAGDITGMTIKWICIAGTSKTHQWRAVGEVV